MKSCIVAVKYLLSLSCEFRGRVWGITLPGSVLLEWQFLNPANFIFRSSTRLVRYYSNFQNFYVLLYIHFLSLVELKRWLAKMHSFPHQHRRQHSSAKTLWAKLFPRPFLTQPEGSVVQNNWSICTYSCSSSFCSCASMETSINDDIAPGAERSLLQLGFWQLRSLSFTILRQLLQK